MTVSALMATPKLLTELFTFFYFHPLQLGFLEPGWKGEGAGRCPSRSSFSSSSMLYPVAVAGLSLGLFEGCSGAHLSAPKAHRAGEQPCPGRVSELAAALMGFGLCYCWASLEGCEPAARKEFAPWPSPQC